MKMNKIGLLVCMASASLMLNVSNTYAVNGVDLTGQQKVYIESEDWGPAISKTVITLNGSVDASSLDAVDFEVAETKMVTDWTSLNFDIVSYTTQREIIEVYLSDNEGGQIDENSGSIITIEMSVDPSTGNAFNYSMVDSLNHWCEAPVWIFPW